MKKNGGIPNINLQDCLLFKGLKSTGSISGAAQILKITQPAATQRLNRLEKDLGVSLWVRRGRGQGQLTEEGERFYQYCLRILEFTHEMMSDISSSDQYFRISVVASTIPGEHLLPPFLARYQKANSDHRIQLRVTDSRQAIRLMAAGRADCGITGDPGIDQMKRAGKPGVKLEFIPIAGDRIILAGSRGWVKSHPGHLKWDDLVDETLILREPGSGTRIAVDSAMTAAGLVFPEQSESLILGSTQAVVETIRRDLGIGFISERARGDLQEIPLDGLTPVDRRFYLITIRSKPLRKTVSRFIRELTGYFTDSEH